MHVHTTVVWYSSSSAGPKWTHQTLRGCTKGSGLSWDMSEITSILLATWRQGGKTNPLSLLPKCRKKVPRGWGWLASTGLLRGFGPRLLGSHLLNRVPVQCSVTQLKAKLQAWALLWKHWLRNRSKRWGPCRLEGGSCRDEEVIQRWDRLLPMGEFELSFWPPTDFQCGIKGKLHGLLMF